MNKRICPNHFGDQSIQDFIQRNGMDNESCGYCDEVRVTIGVWEVAHLVDGMIGQFYESTSGYTDEGESIIGDDGEPLKELLQRECQLEDDGDVLEDLNEILSSLWFERDTHQSKYGEEPRFIDRTRFGDELDNAWRQMEKSLRNEARIVNPQASATLKRVFGPLSHDEPAEDGRLGAILEIGPKSGRDKIYRARVFLTTESLEKEMAHPERSIGPPPNGTGSAGRMNAKGVSVFYGAFDRQVAMAEVRPPVGAHVVVAGFRLLRRARVLDITRLGRIRVQGSKFDRNTAEQHERSAFLATLKRRLVIPVMPGQEEDGYLITQAVADYLSMDESLNLDGIMFPSVQHGEGDDSGVNVILFHKFSKVDRAARNATSWSEFSLYEVDEDHAWMEPRLSTKRAPLVERAIRRLAIPTAALELDRDDIVIHRVTGISFTTRETPVIHLQVTPET
jgi:hypothetical protein